MHLDERPYAIFVSYARRDDIGGWVTTLVDALRADAQRLGERGHRVFFDVNDVASFEEWKVQLRRGLRQSQVLLVCVSQAYFNSDPCLWEWLEHEARASAPGFPVAIVPVFLQDAGVQPDDQHEQWRARVYDIHGRLDLRAMFTSSPSEVSTDQLVAQVRALGDEIHQRREAVRQWESAGTNLSAGTARFVGRGSELARLGEALASTKSIGVVTAVQGLGGIGKTELVRQYGWRNRGAFPAGVWQLPADGHTSMLDLLASLAHDLPGFTLPEDARGNLTEAGRAVRAELVRRTEGGRSMLLILDNVSEPALLSPAQTGELPRGTPFHVAATTRLGAGDFPGSAHLAHVPIGGLSHRASVELIRLHQIDLTGDGEPDFRTADDEVAAGDLATLLDGFTLAVELAAVYLMTHPELTIRQYVDYLSSEGVTAIDAMSDATVTGQTLHQDKLLITVLDATLTDLDRTVPGAALVLRLAAAMPPESVAWPWLERLARDIDPTIFAPAPTDLAGRWLRIRRTLEGRGLITEGRHPGHTGRLHRLIADHLADEGLCEHVDHHTLTRAAAIGDTWEEPAAWELDTVLDALARPLTKNLNDILRIVGLFENTLARFATDRRPRTLLERACDTYGSMRAIMAARSLLATIVRRENPGLALTLYEQSLTIRRQLAESYPADLQAQRDLTVSLNNVAGILEYRNPGQALAHYEQSLTISRQLAESYPADLQAQRDLTVSLDNVAGILRSRNPGQALAHYEQSLTIRRQLATIVPSIQSYWDLGVAAARLAQIMPIDDPQVTALWREAASCLRRASEMDAEQSALARMAWSAANSYAACGPDDAAGWLAYAASLAERFGFE